MHGKINQFQIDKYDIRVRTRARAGRCEVTPRMFKARVVFVAE